MSQRARRAAFALFAATVAATLLATAIITTAPTLFRFHIFSAITIGSAVVAALMDQNSAE